MEVSASTDFLLDFQVEVNINHISEEIPLVLASSISILVLPTALLSLEDFPGSSSDSFLSPHSLAGIQPDSWTFALAQ